MDALKYLPYLSNKLVLMPGKWRSNIPISIDMQNEN
jgi:hypothetical protein